MDTNVTSPIDDLASCHSGILTRLATLSELPALREAAIRVHGIASESLGFFGEVIFQHHLDEERELFPAVLQAAEASEREMVKSIISRLVQARASSTDSMTPPSPTWWNATGPMRTLRRRNSCRWRTVCCNGQKEDWPIWPCPSTSAIPAPMGGPSTDVTALGGPANPGPMTILSLSLQCAT
jgi:hypothetical protein